MSFTSEQTRQRYAAKLRQMEPVLFEQVATNWPTTAMSHFFGSDMNRAFFSARDTLNPMLQESNRVLDRQHFNALAGFIVGSRAAGAVADAVFEAFINSTPKQ
jgi:hypothetical protein